MQHPFNPAPAARLLADAWSDGAQLQDLPSDVRPRTLSEGYDVQDRLIDMLAEPVAGWKLGVGSPRAKAAAGTDRSMAGRLLRSRIFKDRAEVPLLNSAPITVEFEIAFVLARAVEPGGSVPDPLALISKSHVAFEIVQSRFVDRIAVGWPSFVADDVGFNALVLGAHVAPESIPAIAQSLVVSANGSEKARMATGEDAIDPLVALAELCAHASERGLTLAEGAVVTTGTLSKPFDATADVTLEAVFVGGRLSARVVSSATR